MTGLGDFAAAVLVLADDQAAPSATSSESDEQQNESEGQTRAHPDARTLVGSRTAGHA